MAAINRRVAFRRLLYRKKILLLFVLRLRSRLRKKELKYKKILDKKDFPGETGKE